MFRLFFVLASIKCCFSFEANFSKCCDSESVLKKSEGFYNCTKDVNVRIQMMTNDTNFMKESEGYCVDIEDTVALFKINGSEIMKEKEIEVDFYPKCCPLNYFYNSTNHGCVKSSRKLPTFFNEQFVKVGLPQCEIIVDIKIDTKLERLNGSLLLSKQNKIYDRRFYCIDKDQNNLFVARICYDDYAICKKIRCIHKCCPDGQSFVNGSKCANTFIRGLDFSSFSPVMDNVNDSFAIVHGYNTSKKIYPLDVKRFQYHLDREGVFMQMEKKEYLGGLFVEEYYDVEEKNVYCIEHAIKGKTRNSYYFFRIFTQEEKLAKYIYTSIAMGISCVFLIITILYYCISGEKRTVFGKTLISYCFSTLMLYFFLSFLAFRNTSPGHPVCEIIAFLMFYFTSSIFTWMNIMCIDIYWTFGSSKSFSSRQHKSKELKRFMLYSLYGWGFPLVQTAIVIVFYHVKVLPRSIDIFVNFLKCFIHKGNGNYGFVLFSTTPSAIMELCNLTFFILTAAYCLKVKREISKMNDTGAAHGDKNQKLNKCKDRFGLLIKLFLIMGISFLFEVVSTFFNFKQNSTTRTIETIWDTFNSLQGFFIFLIFIFKKRIFKKFEKRMGLAKLRRFSLVSSAMTQTTSLTTKQ